MEQAILLSETRNQWDKLVGWQASMTVKRSRPAKVLVCVEEQIVGEMLVTHFLKTYNPGAFSRRAATPVRELEEYAAEEPVYGWTIADVVVYETPMALTEIGEDRAPVSWKLVEVKEVFPG